MTRGAHEPTPELARWLQEAGRRRIPSRAESPSESDADVLTHFEFVTGRKLRSRAAVVQFLEDLAADESNRARVSARRRTWREGLLLTLLAASFLHYHFWDINLKIALLPEMKVFVPIKDRDKGFRSVVRKV